MENYELTDKFKEMGYTVQAPGKDKTYYLVRQTNKGTEQIYIKLTKKTAEVEYFFNNKKAQIGKKLAHTFKDLLLVYYQDIVECNFI